MYEDDIEGEDGNFDPYDNIPFGDTARWEENELANELVREWDEDIACHDTDSSGIPLDDAGDYWAYHGDY